MPISVAPAPRCSKCTKSVYAAEQVLGPGRKLYHKLCLTCTSCNKLLQTFSLTEHDEMPYCKSCHSREFGIADLRAGNLPHRDDSPSKYGTLMSAYTPTLPRSTSPFKSSSPIKSISPVKSNSTGPTYVGIMPMRTGSYTTPLRPTSSNSNYIKPTSTGGSPSKYGNSTVKCARCGQSVYMAEQTRAINRVFHKLCLRCAECNTALNPGRVSDHGGEPFCARCHDKLNGRSSLGMIL